MKMIISSAIEAVSHDKWVPITVVWRVLRLQTEERSPIWTIYANILKKQSRTAEKALLLQLGGWERC
jgi:hypothetical protein